MVRTRAAVVVALVLSGCNVGFDAPADARITCSSDAQCPSGWFCKPALGRCSQAHDDGLPPALRGTATVTPAFASRGTLVTVQFEVNDLLGVAPVVELDTTPRAAFVPYSQNGLVYTYALAVGPSIAEGVHSVLGRLVSATGAVAQDLALGTVQVDATPPEISRIDVLTPRVRAGQSALVEATFGEALTVAPTARILGGPAMTTVATAQPTVWRFRYDASGAELEDPQGVSVEVNAQDAAGNGATRTATDAFVFDFTAPALGVGSPVVDTAYVRAGQQIVVHAGFTEPLAAAPAARLLGRSTAAVIPLAVAEQVGTAYTFGATVAPTAAEEVYDLQVRSFADAAGNPGSDVTAGGTVTVDRTRPSLTAGPTATKAGARYRAGDVPQFTLTASEALAGTPQARLNTAAPIALPCTAGAGLAWTCTAAGALTGAELPESAVKAVFDLTDPAGNTDTFSADAILDFHAPAIWGSVGLDVTPPAGSLVSSVTAVRAGTRIRVSFTVTEPLAVDPVVVTSAPEALSFSKVSQSGTFYVYEHVLSAAAHAQGAYSLKATLTDAAGNSSAPLLALPAPGIVVDTVAPLLPDVVTTGAITYARAPWGTAATGGAPQFTVTGVAGSAEANATVIAYDGEYVSSSREIGRIAAGAGGAFGPMTLVAADRREVFLVVVDAAGNAADAKPATGVQGVRVRDVAWTATLQNKVAGSVWENPHRLETRARWQGTLEQGASFEAVLPASTTGSVAWTLASTPGWISGSPIATDTRRGRLVVPAAGAVWEWDGETWTSVAATGGPKVFTAAVYDARRGEVLVFDGNCHFNYDYNARPTLWSWDGRTWTKRFEGATFAEWSQSHVHAPGPHQNAFLTYDEARGEVILAPGPMAGLGPQYCGEVGSFDYGTYRWDGEAWQLLPGDNSAAVADGRLLGYDAGRSVVVRRNAGGMAEWNGTAWTTIDPAGITTGPGASATGETAYDPGSGRILFQGDGGTWTWTGTNWARATSSTVAGNLARGWGDTTTLSRPLVVGTNGLYRWGGGSWFWLDSSNSGPPDPVGVVSSATRARLEAYGASGASYYWYTGYNRWYSMTPAVHPPGLTGAAAMDASGSVVVALGTDDLTWRFDGASWTTVTPLASPSSQLGMAWVPGAGAVCLASPSYAWVWSTNTWIQRGAQRAPYSFSPPAPTTVDASHGGIYFVGQWPFQADYHLFRWNAATLDTEVINSAATGLGAIWPIAADGSNRTFVLTSSGTYVVSGRDIVPAAVEDPRGVGYPTTLSTSVWSPSLQSVMVLDGNRTWLLETEARSRPGHLVRFLWPTGGGPGGDCFQRGGACTVRNVAVSWRGLLSSDGSAGSTATISLWNETGWSQVAFANSTSATVQASASATVTGASLLSHLAALPASEIDLAVVLPSGSLPAPLLRTDDVSVTVTYRLP